MQIRESSFGYWSSQPAFLAVASGAALGIGNSIRLPYLMSEYGGLAFLAVYVLFLLLIGLPILVAEWSHGRWMRDELGAGFARLSQACGASRGWKWAGRLAVLCAVLILSYYSVIAGWSMGYLFRSAGGVLSQNDAELAAGTFLRLAQDPERSLAWHTLFMVVVTVIVSYGFRDGIERCANRLAPTIALLSVIFFALAATHADLASAFGLAFDGGLSALGWRGVMEALYLAFFTLGLGLGVMMTLGAYLHADVPLVRMGLWVILIDTLFGLMIGIGVFAVLSTAQLPPASGLALIFQSFPQGLPDGAVGIAMGLCFYLILLLVTLLAGAALLEPVTRFLMERYRQTRVFAATSAAIIVWSLGIGSLLSFSIATEMRLFGGNFFELLQFLTAFVLVPLSAFLLCLFISRVLPREASLSVWGRREQLLHGASLVALRYPARIGLIAILLYGVGLIDKFAALWT